MTTSKRKAPAKSPVRTAFKSAAGTVAQAEPGAAGAIARRMRATLAAIERENPRLNAFVMITAERAMAAAVAADGATALGAGGGPLFGMPVAVKDIIDVEGLPTRAGSLTRQQAPPAERDAHVVARLAAAGLISPGKTNTVEYAFGGYGTNVTIGTPVNPWDRKVHRVPGGSSSGSGVAVGAGLVPAALGTDTGGSVRIPAAMCGCVGLKTSIGLVGRSGVVALSQSLDSVGPLASDVTTAAQMLAIMQGHDPLDAATDGVRAVDPLAGLERGIIGLRLGRVRDADMPLLSAEMGQSYARALRLLEQAGAHIVPFDLPDSLDAYTRGTGIIIAAECYATHRQHVDAAKPELAPPILARMLGGKSILAADYLAARERQRADIGRFLAALDRLDAIVLPTTPVVAMPVAAVDESISPLAAHTRMGNYLELCGLAVPIDLTRDGLPTSLQIVCRRFDDPLALRIGRAFEKVRGDWK